jgi:hypothetical protein
MSYADASAASRLPRSLEPEMMDGEQEAREYGAMDHREVNARFVADLLAVGAPLRRVLDVGTGTAVVAPLGIPAGPVRSTSDRHWTLAYVKP